LHRLIRFSRKIEEFSMDIQWEKTIQVQRPVAQVYAYLADFPRHTEWSLTLAAMTKVREGDARGVGAIYHTTERQAMHTERKPGTALTKGLRGATICEVTALEPNRRIAWRARFKPDMGVNSEWAFALSPAAADTTTLSEQGRIHMPAPMAFLFKLIFGRGFAAKVRTQSDAGLSNIKVILEKQEAVSHRHPA
jgi:uncharacterized membrane protein